MSFVSATIIVVCTVVTAILVVVIITVVVWKVKKRRCRKDPKGLFPVRYIIKYCCSLSHYEPLNWQAIQLAIDVNRFSETLELLHESCTPLKIFQSKNIQNDEHFNQM